MVGWYLGGITYFFESRRLWFAVLLVIMMLEMVLLSLKVVFKRAQSREKLKSVAPRHTNKANQKGRS